VPAKPDPKRLKIPAYWIRPPQSLSHKAGMHRFSWDMHYTPVPNVQPDFPMSATYRNTYRRPTSRGLRQGLRYRANGLTAKVSHNPLRSKWNPRVKTSAADLQEQFDLSWQLYQLRLTLGPVGKIFDDINEQLTKFKARAAERPDVTENLRPLYKHLLSSDRRMLVQARRRRCLWLESVERLFQRNPRRGCRSDRRGQSCCSRMFRQKLGR